MPMTKLQFPITGSFTSEDVKPIVNFLTDIPGYSKNPYTNYDSALFAFRLQPEYTEHSPAIFSIVHAQRGSDGNLEPVDISAHTNWNNTAYRNGSKLTDNRDNYIYKYNTDSSVSINIGNSGAVTYASMRSIDNLDERSMMIIYDDIWYCPDSYKYNTTDPITNYGARSIGHSQTYYMQRFSYRGYVADDIYYLDGGESIVGYGVYTINGERFVKINKNNLFMKY